MLYIYIVVVENMESNTKVEYAFTKEKYAIEWCNGYEEHIEKYNLKNIKYSYKKIAILE